MKEIRCKNCGKLLGKIDGKAEIKCPRCKEINTVNAERSVDNEKMG
jgi:LSD1 subclass zinc finger protein